MGRDQGPHFTVPVFETTCKELGIGHARGSPEHPQSQGQVERQNQLFANIRAVCNRSPASWPGAMRTVMFAHNTSVNKTTGISPHELVFKQQARRPETFFLPKDPTDTEREWTPNNVEERATAAWMRSDTKKLQDVFQLVRTRISNEQAKRRERTKVSKKRPFEVGESVRTRLTAKERNQLGGKKLADLKSKRYVILERNNNTYKIRDEANPAGQIKQRHGNELEAAPPQVLSWETDESDEEDPSESNNSEDETQPRRSTRRREPAKRLQVDWHNKNYEEHENITVDDNFSD